MSVVMEPATTIDLDARIDRSEKLSERRADLDRRDKELGGMRSLNVELEEEERAQSMAGWLDPYRSETTLQEVAAARRGEPANDPRRIRIERLERDVARAVARWSKLRSPDDRDMLRSDALWLLLSWPEHGSAPSAEFPGASRIDLGGGQAMRLARIRADRVKRERIGDPRASALSVLKWISELERISCGSLPLRRDWIDPERRDRDGFPMNTPSAQRALRAAVKQALRDRFWRAERVYRDTVESGGLDLDAALDRAEEESGEPERIPPGAAPEVIADLLSISLDAARAIVARCERLAHEDGALRRSWKLSAGAYDVALSRGGAIVRERWPDSADLLSELEELPRRYRELCERGAILALSDLKHGYIEPERAADAVAEWRGACSTLNDRDRAILGAARSAMKRESIRALGVWPDSVALLSARAKYGAEVAERIASSAPRLIDAEFARKRRNGRLEPSSEIGRTYPGASWRIVRDRVQVRAPRRERALLASAEIRRRANLERELVALLDAGSSNADAIGAARSALRSPDRALDPWTPASAERGRVISALPPLNRGGERSASALESSLQPGALARLARLFPDRAHVSARAALDWISAVEEEMR